MIKDVACVDDVEYKNEIAMTTDGSTLHIDRI